MSQLLINDYLKQLDIIRKISGSARETIVREAFKDLLKNWGRQQHLVFLAEYPVKTATRTNIAVDGALLHELRMPLGYWEAKDANDDLDDEIVKKFRKGYPQDNIIFSDDVTAVLVQHKNEVLRCDMTDTAKLSQLLALFFSFQRPEIADFRAAVEQFKTDLPAVLQALRKMIEREHKANANFRNAEQKFLVHAQEAINPGLTETDVREMLIQHILTEEIFAKVFDDPDFHQKNNVARELYALEEKFFTGSLKKQTLKGLETYYAAIRAAAAQISSHSEKQTFLKVIYENFYKVYNTKAADRLGVVYTPNEIVRFMIDGADWLTEKHFGKNLIDKDVEILDPATGTGTFICEMLEHFRGQPAKLKYKYLNELYANEMAILPYYVANLNIEATYAAITGNYEEFPNLCFVDTLDNIGLHTAAKGTIGNLFGSVSEENVARIKRQNSKRISVVIGNPPYNANQLNENDNNKNREYPEIDKRIKQTYIAESTAQKTKLYDMYARFFRWASDRLSENGVLAFVTNRSFIESRTFDGFRKMVAQEFSDIYIVDLGGDVRANPKLSGTRHNVFGIQTGVAISFMVKRYKAKNNRMYYLRRPEMETADEKLAWLSKVRFSDLEFDSIRADSKGNWIGLADNDFESLLALVDQQISKRAHNSQAVFGFHSMGVVTARDEWVYDFDGKILERKARFLVDVFNKHFRSRRADMVFDEAIKWSETLKRNVFALDESMDYTASKVVDAAYRPFVSCKYFGEKATSDRLTALHYEMFGSNLLLPNRLITLMGDSSGKPFFTLAIPRIPDFNFVSPASGGTRCLPMYRYDKVGTKYDNITDWGLRQFIEHYRPETGIDRSARKVTKEAIFHYCYAVLHDPLYREKYAPNLKREFPRIPFYADFWQWAAWGETLMTLHIGYESIDPFELQRIDTPDEKTRAAGLKPKALLRADKDAGTITLDTETMLRGIPADAWNYKLGNRCALEWILDQYKEKKPKDPTIREKFNTYRFADYKEKVIDLLTRVTTVSAETVRITQAMKQAVR